MVCYNAIRKWAVFVDKPPSEWNVYLYHKPVQHEFIPVATAKSAVSASLKHYISPEYESFYVNGYEQYNPFFLYNDMHHFYQQQQIENLLMQQQYTSQILCIIFTVCAISNINLSTFVVFQSMIILTRQTLLRILRQFQPQNIRQPWITTV